MSNYLILSVPIDTHYEEKIYEFSLEFEGEVVSFVWGKLKVFVFSKNVSSVNCNFLKGVAVDHHDKKVVFHDGFGFVSENGLKDAEGCFLSIMKDNDVLQIFSDKFGVMPKLYTSFPCGGGAVSDSLFMLLSVRRILGFLTSLNNESFVSRSWFNSITYQLISTNTVCQQIKYLPANGVICFYKGVLNLEVKPASLSYLLDKKEVYKKSLIDAASQIYGLVSGLADLNDSYLSLSASGGLDSRVLLCAYSRFKRSFPANDIGVNCKDNGTNDYKIAGDIASKVGVDFNYYSGVPKSRKKVEKMVEWLSFCCGTYDPLYSSGFYSENSSLIRLGGHGGELFKGNYGWRKCSEIGKSKLDVSLYDLFYSEIKLGICSLGLDDQSKISSEFHYLGFRNPIHGGRFLQSTLLGLRPLVNELLVKIAYSCFEEEERDVYKISRDLAILLDPLVAIMPYDKDVKNIDALYACDRISFFGGLGDVEKYYIEGHPSVVKSGAMLGAIKLARDFFREHNIPLQKNELKPFLHDYLMSANDIDIEARDRIIDILVSKESDYKSDVAAGKAFSYLMVSV